MKTRIIQLFFLLLLITSAVTSVALSELPDMSVLDAYIEMASHWNTVSLWLRGASYAVLVFSLVIAAIQGFKGKWKTGATVVLTLAVGVINGGISTLLVRSDPKAYEKAAALYRHEIHTFRNNYGSLELDDPQLADAYQAALAAFSNRMTEIELNLIEGREAQVQAGPGAMILPGTFLLQSIPVQDSLYFLYGFGTATDKTSLKIAQELATARAKDSLISVIRFHLGLFLRSSDIPAAEQDSLLHLASRPELSSRLMDNAKQVGSRFWKDDTSYGFATSYRISRDAVGYYYAAIIGRTSHLEQAKQIAPRKLFEYQMKKQ